jgi:collagen type VII alpha
MGFGRRKIPTAVVGTATAADVLRGVTFSSAVAGVGVEGTMPNNGAPTLQPGQSLAAGYYSGGSAALPGTGTQTFSTPGPFSFTVQSGVTRLRALLTGGGGGGLEPVGSNTGWSSSVPSLSFTASAGITYLIGFVWAAPSSNPATATPSAGTSVGSYTTGTGNGTSAFAVWSYTASASGSVTISFSGVTGASLYLAFYVTVVATGSGVVGQTVTNTSGNYSTSGPALLLLASGGNPSTDVSWTNATALSGLTALDSGSEVFGGAYTTGAETVEFSWSGSANNAALLVIPIIPGAGGGAAITLLDLVPVTPGQSITGTVGAGGASGTSPAAGGATALTIGSTTYTANGGGVVTTPGPGSGGAASTQTGVFLSVAGQPGSNLAGGAAGALVGANQTLGGGAGATSSSAAGPGGGGFGSYNGGDGQVIIAW